MCVTGIEWTVTHWMEAKALTAGTITVHAGLAGLCVVLLFFSQWLLAIKAAVYVRQALGYSATVQQAQEFGRKSKWLILCAYAAGFWQPVLALGIFAICGALTLVLAGTLTIPPAILLIAVLLEFCMAVALGTVTTVYTSVLFLVVACENCSFSTMWSRALELTQEYLWNGCIFITILCSSLFLVSLAWQLPLTILQFYQLTMGSSPEASQLPLYVRVIEVVWGTISTVYSMGVGLMASGMFYRDVRMRFEGLDVLDQLEVLREKSRLQPGISGI